MKFKVGDKVTRISQNTIETIISLTSFKAIVEDEIGQEEISLSDLVLLPNSSDYESSFATIPISKEIKKVLKTSKGKLTKSVKVVDLHMYQLTENKNGMSNHEIVLFQLDAVKKAIRTTDKRYFSKLVFIHGVGTGKLRQELKVLLKQKSIYFQDASFEKYGRGAIEIIL